MMVKALRIAVDLIIAPTKKNRQFKENDMRQWIA